MQDVDASRISNDLRDLRVDIAAIRNEIRDGMIEVAVIKAKLGLIAGGAAIICSVLVQVATRVFF